MSRIRLTPPLANDISVLRLNKTLHGRSKYRCTDVPSHNVCKGYKHWGTGDALDMFVAAGTPALSVGTGTIIRIAEPDGRLGAIYVEGANYGHTFCAVYCHLHVKPALKLHDTVTAGQVVGYVNRRLSDPHLHFELWIDGKAISGAKPSAMRDKLMKVFV